jgi:hypothetical protein
MNTRKRRSRPRKRKSTRMQKEGRKKEIGTYPDGPDPTPPRSNPALPCRSRACELVLSDDAWAPWRQGRCTYEPGGQRQHVHVHVDGDKDGGKEAMDEEDGIDIGKGRNRKRNTVLTLIDSSPPVSSSVAASEYIPPVQRSRAPCHPSIPPPSPSTHPYRAVRYEGVQGWACGLYQPARSLYGIRCEFVERRSTYGDRGQDRATR